MRARLRDESGIALVMAIGIMLVMSIFLASIIQYTSSNSRSTNRQNADQQAQTLAEAGLNNALSVLNQYYSTPRVYPAGPSAWDTGECLLRPQDFEGWVAPNPCRSVPTSPPSPANPVARAPFTSTLDGRTVTWWGRLLLGPNGRYWEIRSTGAVGNPTGPGASDVARTITVRVPVKLPDVQEVAVNNPINWVYANKDLTIQNSVIVASPVYAVNDLTLVNSAKINADASKVAVHGRLKLSSPQNRIGNVDGGPHLPEIFVEGQCSGSTPVQVPWHACGPTLAGWEADAVYALNPVEQRGTVPPDFIEQRPTLTCCFPVGGSIHYNVPAPVVPANTFSTLGYWYEYAQLGPRTPCEGGVLIGQSAAAPNGIPFDTGDGTINNSATPATPINLTPAARSYTCRAKIANEVVGELSWNHATKVLTVKGVIFIDGSAAVDNGYPGNPVFTYDGQGFIYLSGTFSMKQASICAVATATACNTAIGAWDPDVRVLGIVAAGYGGGGGAQSQSNEVGTDEGINLKGSKTNYQGVLIANKHINSSESGATATGPIISVYNNVWAGQSGLLTFPEINFAPSGGGGLTQQLPHAILLAPENYTERHGAGPG